MSAGSNQVVTRFAPSPTGALHVGGARTALFNWAYARQHTCGGGGQFIIRIEDTDQARSTPQSTRGILEDLKWLGINWDQGPDANADDPYASQVGEAAPYFQSQRLDIYRKYCDQLLASGRAYECFKTPAQLTAERDAAKAEKRDYRYDGSDMIAATKQQKEAWKAEGKPSVIRFRTSGDDVVVNDQVLGDVVVKAEQLEDFVIFKGDGFPTYHFAVVVDDALMGVTHVIRAQEHLSNTPKHVALQDALGIKRPAYAHLPLIFNADGSKMSKRDKAKAARAAVKTNPLISHNWLASEMTSALLQFLDMPPNTTWRDTDTSINLSNDERIKVGFHIIGLPKIEASPLDVQVAKALKAFLAKENDNLMLATLIANALKIQLPEIDVADFRKSGYLPEVLLNYLALLGWNPGGVVDRFDLQFIVDKFSFEGVGKSNSKFDRDKLRAFNGDALRALAPEAFTEKLLAYGQTYHPKAVARLGVHFNAFALAYRERSTTLNDPFVLGSFFIIEDDAIEFDAKAVDKVLKKNENAGLASLKSFEPVLAAIAYWNAPAIHTAIEAHAIATGRGMGDIAQPLRVAITGSTVSPAIHDTLAILGKASTLNRIANCLKIHS